MQWLKDSWTIYKRQPVALSGYYVLSVVVSLGLSQLGLFGTLLAMVFDVLISIIFLFYIREVANNGSRSFLACADQAYETFGQASLYYLYLFAINITVLAICLIATLPFGFSMLGEIWQISSDGMTGFVAEALRQFMFPLIALFSIYVTVLFTVIAFLRLGRPAVLLGKMPVADAIRVSLKASWANFGVLATYYTLIGFLGFAAVLFTFGLGLIIFVPVYLIGEYVMWREILDKAAPSSTPPLTTAPL